MADMAKHEKNLGIARNYERYAGMQMGLSAVSTLAASITDFSALNFQAMQLELQGKQQGIIAGEQSEMLRKKIMGDIIDKKYKNHDEEYKNWVINELVYQNGIQMTELFMDVITHLPYFSLYRDFEKFFEVSGLQHLDNALKKGKGVVLLTGHIGNYLFLCSYLALKGYKVNFILEYATFRGILDILRDVGVKLIPSPRPENEKLKPKIKEKLEKSLLNNEIVIIMHDAGIKHHSLVEFFGEACHSPLGGSYLALKYDSPIIPAFIKSCPNKHLHKIRIYPEFKLEKNGLKDEQEIVFLFYANANLDNF